MYAHCTTFSAFAAYEEKRLFKSVGTSSAHRGFGTKALSTPSVKKFGMANQGWGTNETSWGVSPNASKNNLNSLLREKNPQVQSIAYDARERLLQAKAGLEAAIAANRAKAPERLRRAEETTERFKKTGVRAILMADHAPQQREETQRLVDMANQVGIGKEFLRVIQGTREQVVSIHFGNKGMAEVHVPNTEISNRDYPVLAQLRRANVFAGTLALAITQQKIGNDISLVLIN